MKSKGDAETADNRRAKINYVSNIVVIGDPLRREREGKVLLMNLPKTCAEMLMDAPNAWDTSETGHNFMVKAVKGNYINYDASGFVAKPSALGTPGEIAAILAQAVALDTIMKPSFSYDELAAKYSRTFGGKR